MLRRVRNDPWGAISDFPNGDRSVISVPTSPAGSAISAALGTIP